MKELFPWFAAYALAVNLTGFVLMGLDKIFARNNARRIRERTLFLCAFLGGALGTFFGMYAFRHKTQKSAFRLGMPALVVLNLALFAAAWFWF
ncbi:MAG TPA: DUF1294 domain-containing protein [Clostridia bacterium]|nr:DUF1294 domain-containing protein [Clostridia bacterium]